jgi:hypothetical protein
MVEIIKITPSRISSKLVAIDSKGVDAHLNLSHRSEHRDCMGPYVTTQKDYVLII